METEVVIEYQPNEHADALQEMLEEASEWPIPAEAGIVSDVNRYAALREADGDFLKPRDWADGSSGREYIVDPLAGRISGAKADLIFGEDPIFHAADEGDQDQLDGIAEQNDLPSQLQGAADICASEGEVWWRAYVDPELPYPCIQFLSRAFAVPLFRGRKLLAVAFVTKLDELEGFKDAFRWVEIQAEGYVRNLLFRAGAEASTLGDPVLLTDHPDTEALLDEWAHGLDMILAGRVLNAEGPDPAYGRSDYARVTGLLSALNEAVNIGAENARLTGKKRVTVPRRFLREDGSFPRGAEVLIETETDVNPDDVNQRVSMIEFSFEADALIQWGSALEDKILTRTRTAPQLVGKNTEGAQTGPALRARLLDSVLDAHGKGRYWDDELPTALLALQRLDALPREEGGLAQSWNAATEPPSVERRSVLPEDDTERSQRLGQEVGALLKSRRTAIAESHPDWSEDQVDEEMNRIEAENPLPELPA